MQTKFGPGHKLETKRRGQSSWALAHENDNGHTFNWEECEILGRGKS